MEQSPPLKLGNVTIGDVRVSSVDYSSSNIDLEAMGFNGRVTNISSDPDSDVGKTAEQLDDKYNPDGNGEHPGFPIEYWKKAVQDDSTFLGYWDWVVDSIKQV